MAMPLTAYLGVYPDAIRLDWPPATGPVEWYEACVRGLNDEMCGRVPQAWEVAVRACNSEECGDWSVPRGIIMIPEPGRLPLLAAGVGGLGVIYLLRRRSARAAKG